MKYKALPIGVSDFSWSYMAGRWELAYEKNCFNRTSLSVLGRHCALHKPDVPRTCVKV